MKKFRHEKWTINKCLNCDCCVFATTDDEMLVSAQLIRDNNESLLKMMSLDKNFSMPFRVILKDVSGKLNEYFHFLIPEFF